MGSPRRQVLLLIAITTALRLVWGAVFPGSNDETYHYLYTVYPDWSYFDHPPMTMWVAKLGLMLCGNVVTPFSLRLGFTLLFAGSTWLMFRWTERWYGGRAGVFAAAAFNLTAYYTAVGGFALPDSVFIFFALWTMYAVSEAVVGQPGKLLPWLHVGLAFAGAMLSKYHAIFLPAGAVLFMLFTPGARKQLLTAGPYLAVAIGFLGFLPVLKWNSEHDWASFRFQGGRAVGMQFRPEGLLASIIGPVVYLLPWIWFPLGVALVTRLRRFRSLEGIDRLLICQTLVPMTFFLAVSCVRWVLLHWVLIAFVPLYPFVGAKWAANAEAKPDRARMKMIAMTVGVLVILGLALAQARLGVLTLPPDSKDPMADASGWESVAEELERRGILDEPDTFLFTSRWYDSGQLAFVIRNKKPVACYNDGDARGFAFWTNPEDYLGKTGIWVIVDDSVYGMDKMGPIFERFESIGEFPMTRNGKPFRTVRVFRCINQVKPFPFTYPK